MKKYYFICESDNFFLGKNLSEVNKNEFKAILIQERYTIRNSFLSKLNKLHTSKAINRKIRLPFRMIWKAFDNVEKCIGSDTVFIFNDKSIQKFTVSELKRFKAMGTHLYIFFLNTACRPGARYGFWLVTKHKDLFEIIYTIDRDDSKKYGWEYTDQVYCKNTVNRTSLKYDLFFVGMAKDRLHTLHKIYDKFRNCSLKFYITDVLAKEQIKGKNIIYNNYLKYDEVLKFISESNCILEVVQGVQNGFTYRYYEAVCYNKKLLTNNERVLSAPFYNPNFIRYFNDISDIDTEFITKRVDVDYHYNDEYSPNRLVERIMKNENDYLLNDIKEKM